jgi:ADP-heptose:LPS heptosyltransferase
MKPDGPVADLIRKTASLPVLFLDPIPEQHMHVSEYYCRTIGEAFQAGIPEPLFRDFPEHEPGSRYVFIHPGSGGTGKNYSPDLYKNIALALRMNGYDKIAFIMGPAEIERGLPDRFRSEETVYPENVAGLADWLQNASLYIGNDSGVSHLAGFLGIPSIVLYKTTDPRIWGVTGRRVFHIAAKDEESAFAEILVHLVLDDSFNPSKELQKGKQTLL